MQGSYNVEVNTWRPIGNGTCPDMRRFFIGGSPELEDPTYPQKPAMADVRCTVILIIIVVNIYHLEWLSCCYGHLVRIDMVTFIETVLIPK